MGKQPLQGCSHRLDTEGCQEIPGADDAKISVDLVDAVFHNL